MIPCTFPNLAWSVLLIQALGVASLCAVRFGKRLNCHGECQVAFFLGLSLVGFATLLALHFGTADWLLHCTTLAVMVVGASLDFESDRIEGTDAATCWDRHS